MADSVSEAGARLTTWVLTYPRMVHAELMTHRLLSRNSSSSRAIPEARLRKQILEDPAMPVWWGKNQSGMQAREELAPEDIEKVKKQWLEARDDAVNCADRLSKLGLHKQIANRVMEPWMYITVIVTATEWDNWFHLRDHPDAQPEIGWVAHAMHRRVAPGEAHPELETAMQARWEATPYARDLIEGRGKASPTILYAGEWHLPFIKPEDREWVRSYAHKNALTNGKENDLLCRVSVARCARVSYLTHDGTRDLEEDITLAERLAKSGHWSPYEHVATPLADPNECSGNLFGWRQYRKLQADEHFGRRMP